MIVFHFRFCSAAIDWFITLFLSVTWTGRRMGSGRLMAYLCELTTWVDLVVVVGIDQDSRFAVMELRWRIYDSAFGPRKSFSRWPCLPDGFMLEFLVCRMTRRRAWNWPLESDASSSSPLLNSMGNCTWRHRTFWIRWLNRSRDVSELQLGIDQTIDSFNFQPGWSERRWLWRMLIKSKTSLHSWTRDRHKCSVVCVIKVGPSFGRFRWLRRRILESSFTQRFHCRHHILHGIPVPPLDSHK